MCVSLLASVDECFSFPLPRPESLAQSIARLMVDNQ